MALIDRQVDGLLLAALRHLRPYLDDVVIIGGVANALYRHHALAAPVSGRAVGTRDVDIAAPVRMTPDGRPPLADLLLEAGLKAEVHPAHQPPIMKFTPLHDPNVELEFLCPLVGSARTRGGAERLAAEIQPGVTAQQLRYLDLLLFEPWSVEARRIPELAKLPRQTLCRVPNPAAYVMQKILIRDSGRPASQRAKDCYYIYEVALVFRDALDAVHQVAERHRAAMPKAWWQRYSREVRRLFDSADAEGPVAAVREHGAAGPNRPQALDEAMVFATVRPLVEAIT